MRKDASRNYGDSSNSNFTSSSTRDASKRPSSAPFSITKWPPAVFGVVSTRATRCCHVPGLPKSFPIQEDEHFFWQQAVAKRLGLESTLRPPRRPKRRRPDR